MEQQITVSYDNLVDKLSGWLDNVILNLPNIIIALIVFLLAYWFSKKLQLLVNKYLQAVIRQPSIRNLIANIASILMVGLGFLSALSILNLDGTLKSLLAGAGVAGLAISLALQGTLSNTFSGIFIAIKDELNIGDWIETNGFSGKIMAIDLRNTKIKASDNNIIVVPNKLLLENPFKNYGLTKRIRTTIKCGVSYDSDLSNVKTMAIGAIKNIYPPNAGETIEFYYTDFSDSSIDFLLKFWVDGTEDLTALEVKSTAIMTIKETFDKNGIVIPYPTRTLVNTNN